MADIPPSPYDQELDLPGGEAAPPTHQMRPPKKSRRGLLLSVIILVVLIGLGYGAFKVFGKKTPAKPATTATQSTPATKTDTLPVTSQTKTFTADTLAVEFQYPADWTVVEKDGTITIKSPDFSYQTTSGTINGFFRLYIRKVARDVDSKYIGRAVAMQATEPLTYTNPAPSQRKTTNLSFFGYDESNNFAFFMITGNFDLKKGDTLGANYGKEADTYIIVGGYAAKDSVDDLSFHQLPTSSFQNPAQYKQALQLLKTLRVS